MNNKPLALENKKSSHEDNSDAHLAAAADVLVVPDINKTRAFLDALEQLPRDSTKYREAIERD